MYAVRPVLVGIAGLMLVLGGAACSDRRAGTREWSEPVSVTGPGAGSRQPSLTFTTRGDAVVALGAASQKQPARVFAARPGGRTFRPVGRARLLAAPASYGRDGVAYLQARAPLASPGRDTRVGGDPGTTGIGVSFGGPGSLGQVQPLARVRAAPRDVRAALAGGAAGDLAAAWIEPRGSRSLLRVAVRASGHALSLDPPILAANPRRGSRTSADRRLPKDTTLRVRRRSTLERAHDRDSSTILGGSRLSRQPALDVGRHVSGLALAYGAGGDLVVVLERSRPNDPDRLEIAAGVMRRGRAAFGPIQPLGPARGSSSIAVAVSAAGAAVVAWGTQSTYDGLEVSSAWSVRAALLRARAPRFAARQLLDPGRDVSRSVAGVSAAIAASGTASVAWSQLGAAGVRTRSEYGRCYPCPVRVATSGRGGRFGAAAQVARNGAALGIVAARDGTTTVLWGLFARPTPVDDYVESLDGVFASRRPLGAARFARPVALSVPEPVVNGGTIALDPRSQRPAALWSAAAGASPDEGLYDIESVDTRYTVQDGAIRPSRSG